MSIGTRCGRVVVYGVPLAFVIISWLVSAGFPYFLDSNETFLSYVHARNLELWSPGEYGWLTAEAIDPERTSSEGYYSHNPNGPRYLHYVLLRLGVRELSWHVLVLSVLATGITVALLWRLCGQPALMAVPLAVVLDYAGFLAWTVNTYRVWTFVLFFGLVLMVVRRRPLWVGLLTFLLFQVEYGMALFMTVTVTLLAVLTYGRRAWPLILASAAGAVLSLAVFTLQVLAFHGWDGFLHELGATYLRRGTAGQSSDMSRYLFQAWHGPALLLSMVGRDTHSLPILVMVLWGILASLFTLRRPASTEPQRFLARLTLSTVAGMTATSTVLYGYFVDGFVVSMLPLATLLVAPALGVVALELQVLVGRLGLDRLTRWPHLDTLAAVVVLVAVVAASLSHIRPPVAVELFQRLQTEYHGQTIVGPTLGPWHANRELAFALTGGRAFRTSDIDLTASDIQRFDGIRAADGSLTYVCLDTVYLRDIARPGAPNACDLAEARLLERGHRVVAEGTGWIIVQVAGDDRPAAHTAGTARDASGASLDEQDRR